MSASEVIQAPPRRNSNWRRRLMIVTLCALLGIVVLELGIRVAMRVVGKNQYLAIAGSDRTFVAPRGPTRLKHIVRPSTNSRIIFELIPGAETEFMDCKLKVNDDGQRGPCRPLAKPNNTVRILGIGDSVMFGWGVDENETYLAVLAERLNAEYPQVNWEYVNAAVPGYNTSMELAVLQDKGLAYDPDIVIVGYVPNDLGLPNFLWDMKDPWSLSQIYLMELMRNDMSLSRCVARGLKNSPSRFLSSRHAAEVPASMRHMVGPAAYESKMAQMQSLCHEHGAKLLVLSHIDRTRHGAVARDINRRLGIPVISSEPYLLEYMQEHRLQHWLGTALTFSDENPHPSAVWHRLLCDTLIDYLDQEDIIESRIEIVQRTAQPKVNAASSTVELSDHSSGRSKTR